MGAVEVLRLMTKGPGPPRRTVSGKGATKSSMVRCQMSPLNGDFVGAAMYVNSTNGWSVVRIVSKHVWRYRDRRLLAATKSAKLVLCQDKRAVIEIDFNASARGAVNS